VWAVDLEAKLDRLLELGVQKDTRGQVLRVAPPRARPVTRLPAPRLAGKSTEPWRSAWEWLLSTHATIKAAGKAAGLGQSSASRLHHGKRKPVEATKARVIDAARRCGWSASAAA
jgi:hypothetical protein